MPDLKSQKSQDSSTSEHQGETSAQSSIEARIDPYPSSSLMSKEETASKTALADALNLPEKAEKLEKKMGSEEEIPLEKYASDSIAVYSKFNPQKNTFSFSISKRPPTISGMSGQGAHRTAFGVQSVGGIFRHLRDINLEEKGALKRAYAYRTRLTQYMRKTLSIYGETKGFDTKLRSASEMYQVLRQRNTHLRYLNKTAKIIPEGKSLIDHLEDLKKEKKRLNELIRIPDQDSRISDYLEERLNLLSENEQKLIKVKHYLMEETESGKKAQRPIELKAERPMKSTDTDNSRGGKGPEALDMQQVYHHVYRRAYSTKVWFVYREICEISRLFLTEYNKIQGIAYNEIKGQNAPNNEGPIVRSALAYLERAESFILNKNVSTEIQSRVETVAPEDMSAYDYFFYLKNTIESKHETNTYERGLAPEEVKQLLDKLKRKGMNVAKYSQSSFKKGRTRDETLKTSMTALEKELKAAHASELRTETKEYSVHHIVKHINACFFYPYIIDYHPLVNATVFDRDNNLDKFYTAVAQHLASCFLAYPGLKKEEASIVKRFVKKVVQAQSGGWKIAIEREAKGHDGVEIAKIEIRDKLSEIQEGIDKIGDCEFEHSSGEELSEPEFNHEKPLTRQEEKNHSPDASFLGRPS